MAGFVGGIGLILVAVSFCAFTDAVRAVRLLKLGDESIRNRFPAFLLPFIGSVFGLMIFLVIYILIVYGLSLGSYVIIDEPLVIGSKVQIIEYGIWERIAVIIGFSICLW